MRAGSPLEWNADDADFRGSDILFVSAEIRVVRGIRVPFLQATQSLDFLNKDECPLMLSGGMNAKVFASQYLFALPDEETPRQEILATQ